MSRPAAPASVRKQCDRPTYFFGRSQLVEDLVAVHAAERDLGRGDQAQVGVGDACRSAASPGRGRAE